MDIYNKISCNDTGCFITSWLRDDCTYAPTYPPASLVQGNCDDLSGYNNCKFVYTAAEEDDSDTDIIVIITLLAAVILL